MHQRILICIILTLLFFSPNASATAAETTVVGSACSGSQHKADWDTLFQCVSNVWKRAAYWLGSSSDTCDSNHAGLIQWTGTEFQGCDGSSWKTLGACQAFIPGKQTFTTSGTYTPQSGITLNHPLLVRVLVVGGGGSTSYPGGAGSGYVAAQQLYLTSTASVAVTVGGAGGTSSFGSYVAASGGTSPSGSLWVGSNGGGGGGAAGWNETSAAIAGGWGGTNGGGGGYCGSYTGCGGGGAGQGTIVTASNTVLGIVFQSATFSAGSGGSYGPGIQRSNGYYDSSGGGGGGILLNGSGPAGTTSSNGGGYGGNGYGAGGGGVRVNIYDGTVNAGAAGLVYLEW